MGTQIGVARITWLTILALVPLLYISTCSVICCKRSKDFERVGVAIPSNRSSLLSVHLRYLKRVVVRLSPGMAHRHVPHLAPSDFGLKTA